MAIPGKSDGIVYLLFAASALHLFLEIQCSPTNTSDTDLLSNTMPSSDLLSRNIPNSNSLSSSTMSSAVELSSSTVQNADLLSSSTIQSADLLSSSAMENIGLLSSSITQSADLLNGIMPIVTPDYLHGKHKSLMNCSLLYLEPGEYEVLSNGTLYIEVYNIMLNKTLYYTINGTAYFCNPKLFENSPNEPQYHLINSAHITLVGLTISMICLFLHLVVFTLVPDLRNLPGWNLAALCMSLLCSYALLLVAGEVQDFRNICFAVALLIHFFLISSFLWMSIMSFDVYMSLLRITGSLRATSTQFRTKKFVLYCLCAFGVAFAFTLLGLLADILDSVPPPYKPRFEDTCWYSNKTPLLIFFAAPIIALTCLNFMFFILSSCTIHANKMKCDTESQKSVLRRNYLMYFRLSVIMGITWVIGIVAAIGHTDWLWYVFVPLNSLQGLYIFLAFTCSKKVKKFFQEKFMGGRRPSSQTLSPTFQSYCYYANSIEKDLDKIVDSKTVDKDKIDTIVIHL